MLYTATISLTSRNLIEFLECQQIGLGYQRGLLLVYINSSSTANDFNVAIGKNFRVCPVTQNVGNGRIDLMQIKLALVRPMCGCTFTYSLKLSQYHMAVVVCVYITIHDYIRSMGYFCVDLGLSIWYMKVNFHLRARGVCRQQGHHKTIINCRSF